MKPRTRTPGEPRTNVIPIRFSNSEYTLLINAAHEKGITPSTFIAEISMREAARIIGKTTKEKGL